GLPTRSPSPGLRARVPVCRATVRRHVAKPPAGPAPPSPQAEEDTMTVTATDRARLRRARLAVHGLFLLSGIAIGTWTARIPAIKERLALVDGELSLGLLGIAAGAIVGMRLVGRLVDRHGSHRVMIPAAFAQGAVLVPPALAPDLPTLAA